MPGVYISYPFCAQKCSFCNFASDVSRTETRARYERMLIEEVSCQAWDWLPETIYLGGGTPSLMPLDSLRALLNAIPRRNATEITLECAPGTVTRERAIEWKRVGINRVSLGVQSFVTSELRHTGRRHTAELVASDVETLRRAGIENINIDLIAGLPLQTLDSWRESLEWMERLDAPHVSVYLFEVDEESRLGREILSGGTRYGARCMPDDEITAQLYETAVEKLASGGLKRYEISNFARSGWESRHNLKYWQLEPYIGFGLDAHSFSGEERWSNPATLSEYFRQQENETATRRDATLIDASEEHFFVGLRLMDGIEPTSQEWIRFARPIEKWLRAGMVERTGDSLRLTSRAVLLSNEILADFINVEATAA